MNKLAQAKTELLKQYGIDGDIILFGEKTEESLAERFAEIDGIAEYNQLKVIRAFQERN